MQLSTNKEELSQEEVFKKFLSEPKIIENLKFSANHLNEICRGNWTDINRLLKKSVYKNKEELKQILDFIIFSNLAICKVNNKGEIIYKFTLNETHRKNELEKLILELKKN